MQLNVVALTESFLHMVVPGISQSAQFRMLPLETSESDLLHHVGKKRRARAEIRIDLQEPA